MDDNERACAYKIIAIFMRSEELSLDASKFEDDDQLDFFVEMPMSQIDNPQENMTSLED